MRQHIRHAIARLFVWCRQVDMVVLISVLTLVLGVWGFMEIADEVLEGESLPIDRQVLTYLRNADDLGDAAGPIWFEEGVRDVTALGSTSVLGLVVLVCAGFLFISHKPHTALFVIGSAVTGTVMTFLMKAYFARPRPGEVPALAEVHTASFPSAHAQLSAVIYLTLGAIVASLLTTRGRKIYAIAIALLLTALVGTSRVYLGVHYPTDVLAGWAAGIAWAILWWLAAQALRRRRVLEKIESD